MADKLHHETIYRGEEAMRTLRDRRVVLCGAGAIGSNLAESLMRQGLERLRVIDMDRVEEHNLSTQIWIEEDIGALKVKALQNRLYDAMGVEIDGVSKKLEQRNARKLLADGDLVIDGFDNHASRALVKETCEAQGLACLHAGLAADYAEVLWNEGYRVPRDAGPDVCDYPLARNLVSLCVAVTAEVALRFLLDGNKESYSLTLGDLRINAEQQ
jgi:molybdopterin/thiamine biosynthesis adenylyltransferase